MNSTRTQTNTFDDKNIYFNQNRRIKKKKINTLYIFQGTVYYNKPSSIVKNFMV